jgi:uncharacterized protein (UPF0335 family)
MANLIPEEGTRFSDPNDFQSQVNEYVKLKASMAVMEARQKELKEKIFARIDDEGTEDTSGHVSLYLDHPIDGVERVQKMRSAKRALNEEIAERIIEETGIGLDVYEMKRVINEGALMSAYYEERITEDQLDEMFPTTVIWSLRTLKK